MIDAEALLDDAKAVADRLVDDLRARTGTHEPSRIATHGTYERARTAGRTDRSFQEWREDLLAQVAPAWVLACVFVRFCEDNRLVDTALLSGPGTRGDHARDRRAAFFADHHEAGDRDWLVEVFGRYRDLPGVGAIFDDRNPLWQLGPSADGARALLELWWATDDEGRRLRHDFTDPDLDTRFLGDLYQDLSEHARKQFALLQTPEFVEEFILDRTLDPAVETFGLDEARMIDPTCGSGHFLLGAFDRLLERWRQAEPATDVRELTQRALDAANGVDLNPFAVAIARFRLLVAALRASGIGRLVDAPDFRLNVATGDSLLHGTRPGTLLSGASEFAGVLDHHYPTEDAEQAERLLRADTYHAVVGNPPYITVKDKALNRAYRALYETCYRQYSLAVPFKERFFQLAAPASDGRSAGYVGMITANSFMKREFGRKVIEEFLPSVDLTHVIDTSGSYIPGHGTPTVILLGRAQPPTSQTVRAVLGIRGEPGRPEEPAKGLVWSSIASLVDRLGAENEYVSVDDVDRSRFADHPWSLQGGAAPYVNSTVEASERSRLESMIDDVGRTTHTGEDNVYVFDQPAPLIDPALEGTIAFVIGESIRDYRIVPSGRAIFPYDGQGLASGVSDLGLRRHLWMHRERLRQRLNFGETNEERGLNWWEYTMFFPRRFVRPLSIAFAFVATHNHFVLDRGGKVFNRSAPVIKLPEGAGEDEHLGLLGLLNSSAACFWMKQVFYPKGGDKVGTEGARLSKEEWHDRYEFDSTKLQQFPLPSGRPLVWARTLDESAQRLAETLPGAMAERVAPTRARLDEARAEATRLRAHMMGLQEELDWVCYRLYGLTDEELVHPLDAVPLLEKGQRAFEIALARRVAAGEATTSWFERHGSTPITDLPDHWPDNYRRLVERRLALIEQDRAIRLLERPEYKRRWNWDDLDDLEDDAQDTWLLDRIESLLSDADPEHPEVTTVARLADRLWTDPEVRAVAEDRAGFGADPVQVVGRLVASAGVPYLAAYRLKPSGLRKRAVWERTWDLQRQEDALDARADLPSDHPEHLSPEDLARERKAAGLDDIPVPPKYTKADFRDTVSWNLRGKLDVPKERFVLYPGTRAGADRTAVVGWAGWDHLQQARALATLYTARKQDGAEVDELQPLLAGLLELLPWLLQWHDDPDPVYGERMGQFFAGFVDTERAALGLTEADLRGWTP